MPPVASTVDTLTQIANAVLAACESALAVTAGGVPPSVFTTPAQPAFDCEMLAVLVPSLGEAGTSPLTPSEATARRGAFGSLIQAVYRIWVVRCAPEWNGKDPPLDAEKSAVAAIVQQDGWVLWNWLRAVEDTIFEPCLGVHFDFGRALPEQGRYCGWTMTIHATIPGFDPTTLVP